MGAAGRKRGRGRGGRGGASSSQARTPSPLPNRYDFTPARTSKSPPPLVRTCQPSVSVRDYPPPNQLFQHSRSQRRSSESQPANSPRSQPRTSPPPQPRSSTHSHHRPSPMSEEQTSPAFEATNSEADEGATFEEEEDLVPANLAEDQLQILNAMLTQPGREEFTTVLSPIKRPNTTWFGRDKSSLTRKITKVFTNKFDGPFYSWTCVPRERQERFFVEFAKTHTWDPLVTGVVQQKFESICQQRMKDMVSKVRTSREQPNWIGDTLWKQMTQYWNTEEAKEKSATTSGARLSEQEELGRPVSLGEVFIKTHTKADGTFVDRKAESVAERYKRNLEARISNQGALDSYALEELTVQEENDLFLQSTFTNERGIPYGIGSLSQSHINGKRKYPGSSSTYKTLQEQLEEAQRKIEEQAAENARQNSELTRVSAEQQAKINKISLVERYLAATDPGFLDFLAANNTSEEPDDAAPMTSALQTIILPES
ncbi:uncharacterized protein LOC112087998 [Eutrema salsugineum]|uniref:uncharacterized protein LOC112087998 n=1 Tax=Eutrema salsugineum TaxID=72664 RepID=UPI000CED2B28|nr:uncharacterized protein LOC112087998 [Eutrema salsugineum]